MAFKFDDLDDKLPDMHDINVTPFIDVMLVLLIIFMVAAPLATVTVPVDLPTSTASPPPPQAEPVYVSLRSDLSLFVGEQKVSQADFAGALNKAAKGDTTARILVRADRSVNYGDIMKLLNSLGQAGYLKIALVGKDAPGDAPANGN